MEFVNANKGMALCKEGKHVESIPHLTKAIAVTMSPIWLLARAEAYIKASQFERALVDAEHAYNIAAARQHPQRLEQMLEAQYRRGVALFRIGRHADADACLLWAVRLGSGASAREDDPVLEKIDNNGFYNCTAEQAEKEKPNSPEKGNVNQADLAKSIKWVRAHSMRQMCLAALTRLPADAAERKLAVTRTPVPPPLVGGEYNLDGVKGSDARKGTGGAQVAATAATVATTTYAKPQQLRFDFFQSSANVTLSIFCKGVDKTKFRTEANSRTIVLHNIPKEGDTPVVLNLAHDVESGAIKQFVGSVKVELTLIKAQPGEKWKTWGNVADSSDSASASQLKEPVHYSPETEDEQPKPEPIPGWVLHNKPPPYPTSSKSGPKDWEKLGEDEEEPQDVNNFFEKLYKDAAPEARRAMMKSYTESNGTELSMDWSDVGNRQVEVHPPEGVDVKSWDGMKRQ